MQTSEFQKERREALAVTVRDRPRQVKVEALLNFLRMRKLLTRFKKKSIVTIFKNTEHEDEYSYYEKAPSKRCAGVIFNKMSLRSF